MIRFRCSCGAGYDVDDSLANQKCRCETCGQHFFVPPPTGNPDVISMAIMIAEPPMQNPVVPPSEPFIPSAQGMPYNSRMNPPRPKMKGGRRKVAGASPAPNRMARGAYSPPPKKKSNLLPIVVVGLLILVGGALFIAKSKSPEKKQQTKYSVTLTEEDDDTSVQTPVEDKQGEETVAEAEPETDVEEAEETQDEETNTISKVTWKPDPSRITLTEKADKRYIKLKPKRPSKRALVATFTFDGTLKSSKGDATLKANKDPEYVKGVSGKAVYLHSKGTNNITIPDELVNAKAGSVNLWVKLSDDFTSMWGKPVLFAKNQKGKNIEVLTWSEHRCEFISNYSETKYNTARSDYYLPDRNDWVNLTITWDKKANKHELYVDGKRANSFGSLKMPKDGSAITSDLSLRVWGFIENSSFYADELRLYRKALTPAEIKSLILKYHPIEVKLQDIETYKRVVKGKPKSKAHIATTVTLVRTKPFKGKLLLRTVDKDDKVLWKNQVSITLKKRGETKNLEWEIPMPKKDSPVYLTAELEGSKITPTWGVKVTCITSTLPKNKTAIGISSRALKKICSVNCAKKPKSSTFYSNKPTKVVRTKRMSYRETPWEPYSLFAYKFKIKHPGKRHILRAIYPDNKPRVFALDINDGSGLNPQGAGIMTGLRTPLTGKIQTQDIMFIPETENCLLIACNWSTDSHNRGSIIPFKPKTGAALAGFEVYEVGMEQLPKLPINKNTTDEGRSVGIWVEDAGQTAFWGTPSNEAASIEGWVTSVTTMAKYMDFAGINEYQYPVVWYDGPLFNCPTLWDYNDIPEERIHTHQYGAFDVLLRIFEKHNLKFYPIFYFRNIAALFGQADIKLPQMLNDRMTEEVWERRFKGNPPAGDDVFQYLRNGKHRMRPYDTNGLQGATAAVGPVFNPLHPSVNKLILGMYEDWLKQYANYPALGGITLDMGLTWGGVPQADSYSFDRLDSGYGDFTISLFSKDTGIDVPGDSDDPERFEKRYKFLTSPKMKDKWIKWRCEQIRDKVIMPIYQMIRKYNPKLIIQLGIGTRPEVGPKILNKKLTWNEAALQCGLDVRMYKGLKNLHFVRHGGYFQNPTKCYPLDNLDSYWPNPGFKDVSALTISSGYWEMFSHGDLVNPIRKKWPEVKPNQLPVRTIIDAREGILARTAYALMKDDMQCVYMTGVGALPIYGHEDVVLPFFKAFRALPRKRFSDIPGLSDPVRVRQLKTKKDTFVYLVNADSVEHSVVLNFDNEPGKGYDLRTDKQVSIPKNSFKVNVPAYQLVAYKIPKPVKVTSGKVIISETEMKKIKKQFASLHKQLQMPHAPEKKGKVYIGIEAENFTKWPSKERYFITNPSKAMSQEQKTAASGGGVIGFGGGSGTVEYDVKFPRKGKYTLWVKFAMNEVNKEPSKWRMSLNGEEFPIIESPAKGKRLWVKVGTVNVRQTDAQFTFEHATTAYSIMVDAFLFTNDKSYKPIGGVDYKEKMVKIENRLKGIKQALAKKHIAKAKLLIDAIKATSK